MTTERRLTLCPLLASTAISAAAQPGMAQSSTQPATQTGPVRGLEGLEGRTAQAEPQSNGQSADTTAIPIPAAPKIVLPASTSSSRTRAERASRPAPDRSTRPAPTARDADADAVRTPAPVTTSPVVAPAPVASSATSTLAAKPAPSTAVISAAPATSPAPSQTAANVATPETGRAMPLWLWLLVIVVVLGALWALKRRRPERPAAPILTAPVPRSTPTPTPTATPAPNPTPAPEVAAPALTPAAPRFLEPRAATPPASVTQTASRARLTVELRPLRAGLNMLSAATESELVVTNTGDAPAAAIRVAVGLFTAHTGQDADLAAFNAGPIPRPVTPPFALAPGETRTIRAVAATPRDAIRTMTAAGRPMFVPIVAANLLYASGEAEGQSARAWAIGIERVDSAKLAPFWLDGPAKMFAGVAARPHAVALER